MNPLVSVVIPCYNLGQFLEEAIDSVLAQTYTNYEIIVVNDGSTDKQTVRIIKKIKKNKTKIYTIKNQGLSGARNFGITKARGKYILPLDADDRIGVGYLEKAVAILEKQARIGIVYCQAELFGLEHGPWELPPFTMPGMLKRNLIFCTALFRKKDWLKVGGYCTGFKKGFEDYDFWLSILTRGLVPYCLPEVLFFYRIRKKSMTRAQSLVSEYYFKSLDLLLVRHQSLYQQYPQVLYELLLARARSDYELIQELKLYKYANVYWPLVALGKRIGSLFK